MNFKQPLLLENKKTTCKFSKYATVESVHREFKSDLFYYLFIALHDYIITNNWKCGGEKLYLDNAFVDREDVPSDLRFKLGTVHQVTTKGELS